MTDLEPATPAHAQAMAWLHARAFPEGERWSAEVIALQLGLPGAFGWIVPAGGMVLARVAADEAEILTLAVEPSVRGQGIGRELLRAAMRSAADRGAPRMFLEVSQSNAAALVLYAGCGFAPVGRRRSYYRDGADALVLAAATACGSRAG